jgi:hypothetical protein
MQASASSCDRSRAPRAFGCALDAEFGLGNCTCVRERAVTNKAKPRGSMRQSGFPVTVVLMTGCASTHARGLVGWWLVELDLGLVGCVGV